MFFAIYDYLNYFYKRGPYSCKSLEAEGGMLATKENFPNLEDFEAPSFMFCHTRTSLLSWLVMYYTNSMWSHVAGFLYNGVLADCTTSGVIKHSALNYLDNKSYLYIIKIEDIQKDNIEEYIQSLESQVGKGFNWLGVLHFGFDIITGNDENWRLKHSLDIIILLFALQFFIKSSLNLCTYLGTVYVVFLTFNLVKRKLKKENIYFIKENEPNQPNDAG